MNTNVTKIFLVDDSKVAIEVLRRVIESVPQFKVIGTATSGKEALMLLPVLKPDLVCLDYYLPDLQGVPLVKDMLALYPVPILIISGLVKDKNSKEIFDVLEAGALDFSPKPASYDPQDSICKKILEKIRVLAKVHVIKRYTTSLYASDLIEPDFSYSHKMYDIVVIGSSTGGPSSLLTIFKSLPHDFPVPIICVQHMSKGFLIQFIEWLATHCEIHFKIMQEKEKLKPGIIYFPQENKHLKVNEHKQLVTSPRSINDKHCPSIDVTMQSVSRQFNAKAIGILLTGMGADGAKGLLDIRQAGGLTIAQSEKTCVVFGMPKEAIDLEAAQLILDDYYIGPYLLKIFQKDKQ